jgi:hypothetical protein
MSISKKQYQIIQELSRKANFEREEDNEIRGIPAHER